MPFLARIRRLLRKPISKARFSSLLAESPRRFSFARKTNALSRGANGPAVGFLNVPFPETLESLMPWSVEKASGKFGDFYRRVIRTESEYAAIEGWIAENADIVFIRSLLDSCIALSEHQTEPGHRTAVGELEKAAKFDGNSSAESEIVGLMVSTFRRLFGDQEINAICSVPPSTAGGISLPNRVAAQMSASLGIEDITGKIRWKNAKPSIKETAVEQKWDVLEDVGLDVDEFCRGRNVLLVDDMYQSGSTIHFIASKLRVAGVEDIHCFAIVKALSDKDNT